MLTVNNNINGHTKKQHNAMIFMLKLLISDKKNIHLRMFTSNLGNQNIIPNILKGFVRQFKVWLMIRAFEYGSNIF